MLSHRSLALSAAIMIAALFPGTSFSQQAKPNGGWVTRNGNVFELSKARMDTVVVVNPVTEEEEIKIHEIGPQPTKMNGVSIAQKVDKWPYFTAPEKDLENYLIKKLDKELSSLHDGTYWLQLNDIITDEKGRVVYFDYAGLQQRELRKGGSNEPVKQTPVDQQLQDNLRKKIQELVDKVPAYIPATLNGQNVPAYTGNNGHVWFTVTDHKIKVN